MADIVMPQLGETVTEGTITRWMKQVGDAVAEDEVLFEVSTDKVDSEVPSPSAGTITEILVQEGDTVDVGTKLAVISAGGAAPASGPAEVATGESSGSPDLTESPQEAPAEPPAKAEPAARSGEAQPAEGREPLGAGASTASAPGGGGGGAGGGGAGGDGGGKVLSPVVRRLIAEYHLDADAISGSGAGGRITRSDVLAAIDKQQAGNGHAGASPEPAAPPAPAPAAPAAREGGAAPAPPTPAPAAAGAGEAIAPFAPATPGERDTVVPFTNIRRRTAEHMVRSKHTSAHTMVAVEVDYAGVDKVRQAAKSGFKEAEGFSLTYLPFIARAAVDAIAEFPHVNSSVGDDVLIVHDDLNLGIAVDLDFEGLLVPVIHQADGKRLRQLARDISDLARRARAKKLTMDDIAGGTFTITNAGPFGTFITVPVINQPQVAILSTDGVRKKPVVVELPDGSDSIAIHPVGNLVLSWDHRAFDGAYAAAFLARVKAVIESRDWSTEL